jgi:hypothetical protein
MAAGQPGKNNKRCKHNKHSKHNNRSKRPVAFSASAVFDSLHGANVCAARRR